MHIVPSLLPRVVSVLGLLTLVACGEATGPIELETAEGAVVKGENLPGETCLRRNTDGTTTTGACSEVCAGKTIYEPDTDAEVDAISSNGGVCIQSVTRRGLSVAVAPSGTLLLR